MSSKASQVKKSAKPSSNTMSNLDQVTYRERVLDYGLKLNNDFNIVLCVTCCFDFIGKDDKNITIVVDYDPTIGSYNIYEGIYPKYAFSPKRGKWLEGGADGTDEPILLSNYPEIKEFLDSIEIECNENILDRIRD